jgi:hypothetical protein
MSCCCCTPEGAGITLGGIAFVFLVAFVALNMAAILHFLLMVLLGTLAVGTVITTVGALAVWRMRSVKPATTARYTVEQVPRDDVLEGEVVTGGIDGAIQKGLEAGRQGSISFGFAERSDGTIIPSEHWADGSPVRPVRHSWY